MEQERTGSPSALLCGNLNHHCCPENRFAHLPLPSPAVVLQTRTVEFPVRWLTQSLGAASLAGIAERLGGDAVVIGSSLGLTQGRWVE